MVFDLAHDPIGGTGWLSYSHYDDPPGDRQVISGFGIFRPSSVRLARWYFLSDAALQIINPSAYLLHSVTYGHWQLEINDAGRAALFKLRFM